ncbi:MAG: beta-L-arabinofuranosidase domain-containing protein [Lachnospiraceae bacterium]
MNLRVKECSKAKIRLTDGSDFYDSQEKMLKFLLSVEDDRMLYNFRQASGLDTKGVVPLDGWDALDGKLRGHTTGHYMSALALCYHSTGNIDIKEKAVYVVNALEECQNAFSKMDNIKEGFLSGYSEEQFDLLEKYTTYPTIWAPYYTLHKILAGLLDCYRFIACEKALLIAEKIGMWTWNRLSRLPKRQLTKMWGMYIAGEFGGMNATMTELYMITGKEEFLRCARLFDNDKLFYPLEQKRDSLGEMHANQHIPQMIGALRLFEATGEKRYYDIAEFFWQIVVSSHCYANGGTGESEMFRESGKIAAFLNEKTIETCASYNMLKLTKELYQYSADVSYMDYYELTLLNHILATQDEKVTGETTYFFPLGPGMRRKFLFENSCCHGTGMESRFKYREGIYFFDDEESIYINLFIPSTLCWNERDIFIQQENDRSTPESVRIFIKGNGLSTVKIRIPCWADEYRIIENGKEISEVLFEKGYLLISRDFSQGAEIELEFSYRFQIIRTPDEPEKVAVQYGPYIMAALSEQKEFIQFSFSETTIEKKMIPTEEPLRFECEGFTWIPLCRVGAKAYHTYVLCLEE